jgi:hypothetical protein
MTIILKKGQRLSEALAAPNPTKSSKRLNARKFVGVLKPTEDPLKIQKRMRDEWK